MIKIDQLNYKSIARLIKGGASNASPVRSNKLKYSGGNPKHGRPCQTSYMSTTQIKIQCKQLRVIPANQHKILSDISAGPSICRKPPRHGLIRSTKDA